MREFMFGIVLMVLAAFIPTHSAFAAGPDLSTIQNDAEGQLHLVAGHGRRAASQRDFDKYMLNRSVGFPADNGTTAILLARPGGQLEYMNFNSKQTATGQWTFSGGRFCINLNGQSACDSLEIQEYYYNGNRAEGISNVDVFYGWRRADLTRDQDGFNIAGYRKGQAILSDLEQRGLVFGYESSANRACRDKPVEAYTAYLSLGSTKLVDCAELREERAYCASNPGQCVSAMDLIGGAFDAARSAWVSMTPAERETLAQNAQMCSRVKTACQRQCDAFSSTTGCRGASCAFAGSSPRARCQAECRSLTCP